VVTVVGVAYRGHIPLQDIRVDFQVEPLAHPPVPGFGVRKTLTLYGPLSDTEQRRLHRAAEYCPVGQLFTKGALVIENQVESRAERAAPVVVGPSAQALQPLCDTPPACAPGAVHSRYLAETKEYTDGVLQHEGEVKIYMTCANLTRPGRWTLLAGHNSAGWMPPPVPLACAAYAASTATTLRQCVSPEAWPMGGFHIEIVPHGAGSRDQAQTNAAAGTINARRAVRKIVVYEAPSAVLVPAIQAALQQDPLSSSWREGGVLLSEQIVVA
jgi:hypothetical protein